MMLASSINAPDCEGLEGFVLHLSNNATRSAFGTCVAAKRFSALTRTHGGSRMAGLSHSTL